MKIAVWDNNKWNDGGNGFYTGNNIKGTVRSDTTLTMYGDLTLANNYCDFVVLAGQDTAICYGTICTIECNWRIDLSLESCNGIKCNKYCKSLLLLLLLQQLTLLLQQINMVVQKLTVLQLLFYPLPIVEAW